MSHLSRWFVLLGVLALLPAALLLGADVGAVLRYPSLGIAPFLEHEAVVVALGVTGTFLLSTAAGLRDSRTWALVLGMSEAALLIAGGVVLLVGNARVMAWLGAPEVMTLAIVPVGIAALVLGARLLRALWVTSDFALPFSRRDLQALGALAGVVVVATLGHVVVSGLAS